MTTPGAATSQSRWRMRTAPLSASGPPPVLDRAPVAIAAGTLFLTGLILACVSFRRGRHNWLRLEALCGLPCLLLLVCSNLSLYPMNERMILFLLRAVVLLGLTGLQLRFFLRRVEARVGNFMKNLWNG